MWTQYAPLQETLAHWVYNRWFYWHLRASDAWLIIQPPRMIAVGRFFLSQNDAKMRRMHTLTINELDQSL